MLINMRKNLQCQKGFTLVELMVVIAIIGVLAAIAVPRFTASSEGARGARVQADLRTLDSAIMMLAANNGGALPANGDTSAELVDAANSPLLNTYLTRMPTPPAGIIRTANGERGTAPAAYSVNVATLRAQIVTTGTGAGTFTADTL